MDIINPATEEVIDNVQEDDVRSVEKKYEKLKGGLDSWRNTPLSDRIALIDKFKECIKEEMSELADVLSQETGKPLAQAIGELKGTCNRIKFFVNNSEQWLAPEDITAKGNMTERIVYEPFGVIGNISAWNFPYAVGVNIFIPALIAGNTVLFKASEFTALTGLAIERLMHKAGVPEDVFQAVTGAREVGEAMLNLPLDGYFFTGSHATGKYIYETVAKKMVPCLLELGGKDPLYVTANNSDIKSVAAAAADGAFYNNGQSCCAVERIYVHENVYDEFVDNFKEVVSNYQLGGPKDEGVTIGPLTRGSQIGFLENQISDAESKGAEIVLGGHAADRKGYFFEPTVLTNVNHTMSLMKDESFGPIIGIQKVSSDEEAVSLMKDTTYGLTSSVFTEDEKQAHEIMDAMNSGTVYWNCCDRVSPNLPWSGRKHSGIGATLSHLGIRAFVQPKAYHLNSAEKKNLAP
jgi:acyl-CoA reductase-like NAD-dependent aldehyde dehydrogenase